MELKEFKSLVKAYKKENEVEDFLNILPSRYHNEFLGEVIVDEASIEYFRKVAEMFLAEIFEELSQKEKDIIGEKYIIIQL